MILWTKAFRRSLISALYVDIFADSVEGLPKEPNWTVIVSEFSTDQETLRQVEVIEMFEYYQAHRIESLDLVKKYMNSWNKTYDLIKACLVALVIEIKYLQRTDRAVPANLVGKYIRLAQDFAGGDNPGLVHAVGSKIMLELVPGEKDETTPTI